MEPGPLPDRLPRLAFIDGPLRGHTFELDGGRWSLGRGRGNRLTVEDPSLSRQHCSVEFRGGAFRLADLDSHNGTFVNGLPVHDHLLRDGDEIKAGHSVFHFLTPDSTMQAALPSVRFEGSAIENPTMLLLRREDSVYLKPGEAWYHALLRITAALHANLGVEALADRLLATLLECVPADRAAILLFRAGEEDSAVSSSMAATAATSSPMYRTLSTAMKH